MGYDRAAERTTASVERRPAIGAVINRSTASAAPQSPILRLRQRLGNQGTLALINRLSAKGDSAASGMAGAAANARSEILAQMAERSAGPGGLVSPVRHQPQVVPAGQRDLRPRSIQTKLTISHPGDIHEQEADRVADQVMRMAGPEPISTVPCAIQRKCAACEANGATFPKSGEEEKISRKEKPGHAPQPTPVIHSQIAALRGGGQPLPLPVRAFFDPRFNRDFGGVRIHTGSLAAESARTIQARAFTAGQHVVFGAGEFAPETSSGGRLLAHELTHVVQQGGTTATGQDLQSEPLGRSVTPVGAEQIQPDWLDDAKAAVSDTYESGASAASDAYNTVASGVTGAYDSAKSTVGTAIDEVAKGAKAAAATVSTVSKAAGSHGSDVSNTVSKDPEKTRANLIARVSATRQKVQNADPDAITADASQIGSLNQNISSLNSTLPPAVLPTVIPLVAPAAGAGLGGTIEGALVAIGAAIGAISVSELIVAAIVVLAIIAIILGFFGDEKKFDPFAKPTTDSKTGPKIGPKPDPEPDPKDKIGPDLPPPLPDQREKKGRCRATIPSLRDQIRQRMLQLLDINASRFLVRSLGSTPRTREAFGDFFFRNAFFFSQAILKQTKNSILKVCSVDDNTLGSSLGDKLIGEPLHAEELAAPLLIGQLEAVPPPQRAGGTLFNVCQSRACPENARNPDGCTAVLDNIQNTLLPGGQVIDEPTGFPDPAILRAESDAALIRQMEQRLPGGQ